MSIIGKVVLRDDLGLALVAENVLPVKVVGYFVQLLLFTIIVDHGCNLLLSVNLKICEGKVVGGVMLFSFSYLGLSLKNYIVVVLLN